MKAIAVAVAVLLLAGCDAVASREVLTEQTVRAETSCMTRTGVCFSCVGFALGGKSPCGLKFSPLCPGVRDSIVRDAVVRRTFESGRTDVVNERTFVRALEACR